ncbi:MAG TPA: beta-ketoacyl-[acyl-carrier-protein] synthase II [Syntrophobacteraceae bacterium]|nr:beta-ketoacyl-[acyl-carrier-protein] synthase II [Syntrophobacteraceae bacterium]
MASAKKKRRVVVTGYGMITPLGRNTTETFENACKGVSGVDWISSFDTRGLPCRVGGQVPDEWLEAIPKPAVTQLERFASRGMKLMHVASSEATQRARLHEISERRRIGVALGYHGENPSITDINLLHRFYSEDHGWNFNGLVDEIGYSCFNFFRRKSDVGSTLLAILNDCQGTNLSVVSACAAGAQAIGEAYRHINAGRCEVMLAGGAESNLNFVGFVGFVLIRALCERYSTPQAASRPFDRKRNGFIMSEGAAAVILEEMEHARQRNAPILGEVLGYGASADAHRITDVHPQGQGAILAIEAALADAGLGPEAIDYINAHGTSTQQNDLVETLAIKKVFAERANTIPVSSNKSMIGHTIAAAGAIECILTLMGIHHSVLLPTINYEFPDPKCALDYVPNLARQQEHRIALSNSFGFGGQNACLCLAGFTE